MRILSYFLYPLRQRTNAASIVPMAKKIQYCNAKFTFRETDDDTIIFQAREQCTKIILMSLAVGAEDNDVMQVWPTNRLKAGAALCNPNERRTYSNMPKGVVIGVFGISASSNRIWCNALMRSTLLKMLGLCSAPEKYGICGIG